MCKHTHPHSYLKVDNGPLSFFLFVYLCATTELQSVHAQPQEETYDLFYIFATSVGCRADDRRQFIGRKGIWRCINAIVIVLVGLSVCRWVDLLAVILQFILIWGDNWRLRRRHFICGKFVVILLLCLVIRWLTLLILDPQTCDWIDEKNASTHTHTNVSNNSNYTGF